MDNIDLGQTSLGGGAEPAEKQASNESLRAARSVGSQLLGDVVGLLTQSPNHRHLFLADLEWLIGPPMMLRQFRLFRNQDLPVGVTIWATVSDEIDKELKGGRTRLKPDEWKSGNNIWLIELIAPTIIDKPKLVEALLGELSEHAFGKKAFKMRARDPKRVS